MTFPGVTFSRTRPTARAVPTAPRPPRVGRLAACVLAVLIAGWSSITGAQAQSPASGGGGASMPLPLAVDLKKVPVGSWSEYHVENGQNAITIRLALVARSASAVDVETQLRGGQVAALGQTTIRMSLPTDGNGAGDIRPRDQVMQIGDNAPMTLPVEMAGGRVQSFRKLDPKERVGVDSVKVPAGTFARADHYRQKGSAGETVDFWISKTVLPFGLVKVTSTALGEGGTPVSMELTGNGGGVKPAITKRARPFDAATIMKEAQPAMGGGAPAAGGGPPVRGVPSPHPGMPPQDPRGAPVSPRLAPHGDPKGGNVPATGGN